MCWNTSQRNAINVKGAEEVRFILELGDTKNLFTQSAIQQNSKERGTKIWGNIDIHILQDKLKLCLISFILYDMVSSDPSLYHLSYDIKWWYDFLIYLHMLNSDIFTVSHWPAISQGVQFTQVEKASDPSDREMHCCQDSDHHPHKLLYSFKGNQQVRFLSLRCSCFCHSSIISREGLILTLSILPCPGKDFLIHSL